MVDLYITSKDFEDNLIRETKIGELIKNNKVRILLADKDSEAVNQIVASEKCLSHNCYIKLYYQGGKASNPMPGLEMMNAFKEYKDIYDGYSSRSIVLLGEKEKEDEAKKIEKHFGVKCIIGKKGLQPLKGGKGIFFKEEESGSWKNDVFDMIDGMPCNAIIINDHYIDKGDDYQRNLCDIIKSLSAMRCSPYFPFHILIIIGKNLFCKKDKFEQFTEATINTIVNHRIINFDCIIEFLYCDDSCKGKYDLYKYTHDRFVISNFSSIDASHSLKLFNAKDGKVITEQKITVGNLLYEDTLKMTDTLICRIATEIKKGNENHMDPNNPYHYIRYDYLNGQFSINNSVDMRKIQNRLIVDELNKL